MRIVAPGTSELQNEMPPESTNPDRRWGLSAVKCAYEEMYPHSEPQFIEEIAKRIEQGVFTKTSSSQDYETTITHTANSIKALAQKTAQNVTQGGAPESVTGGTLHLPRNGPPHSSVGRNQASRGTAPGPYSLPDPSDVINLVPLILEAGVQVLGKIETAQQVRALSDGQKSTVGFLAFEKLSKFIAPGGRGLSISSRAAHPSLSDTSPLYLHGFSSINNTGVNNLPQRNANHGGSRAAPCITFTELKEKYKERIERLLPLIDAHFKQGKNKQLERSNDPQLYQSIAFVRAGLAQDTVTNPEALQSLETLSIRILDLFGHFLDDDELCEANDEEKLSHEDSLPSQRFIHHHRDNTDDSVDLGETDSYTEDDEDEQKHPKKQSEEHGSDTHDPENACERVGKGTLDGELLDEHGQQEYSFEEDELPGDALEEPNIADTFLDEILAQQQHTSGNGQRNAHESNDIMEDPGIMGIREAEVNHQLELLIESICEPHADLLHSSGLEPIPFPVNENNVTDESKVEDNVQEPRNEERKTVEEQASANPKDSPVPAVTPRRSSRIRSKAPGASTNDNTSRQNTTNLAKTPRSKKETPAKTLPTRKTPRRTPRKTPRK